MSAPTHPPTGLTANDLHQKLAFRSLLDDQGVVAYLRTVGRAMWSYAESGRPYQAGYDTAYMLLRAADALDALEADRDREADDNLDLCHELSASQWAVAWLSDACLVSGAALPALPPEVAHTIGVAKQAVRRENDLMARGLEAASEAFEAARTGSSR